MEVQIDNTLYKTIKHSFYKYELLRSSSLLIPFHVPVKTHEYFIFYIDEYNQTNLEIHRGYRWDGASGPTWDTPDTMFPSLVHDVFYQCLREEWLPMSFRKKADELFHQMLLEAGMPRFRAWYIYAAVRTFGYFSSKQDQNKRTHGGQ